jgi:hypothetical protein
MNSTVIGRNPVPISERATGARRTTVRLITA